MKSKSTERKHIVGFPHTTASRVSVYSRQEGSPAQPNSVASVDSNLKSLPLGNLF